VTAANAVILKEVAFKKTGIARVFPVASMRPLEYCLKYAFKETDLWDVVGSWRDVAPSRLRTCAGAKPRGEPEKPPPPLVPGGTVPQSAAVVGLAPSGSGLMAEGLSNAGGPVNSAVSRKRQTRRSDPRGEDFLGGPVRPVLSDPCGCGRWECYLCFVRLRRIEAHDDGMHDRKPDAECPDCVACGFISQVRKL